MTDADRPELSVILVSYNTRAMTLDCLRCLQDELQGLDAEVWLVDNGSSDGTGASVAEKFPETRLILNEENRGFGAANNQAMAEACGNRFLLLNTDAFVQPGSIGRLMRFLDEHEDVAAVGPQLLNEDGSHQESVHRLDTPGHAVNQYVGLSRLRRPSGREPTSTSALLPPGVYLKGACLLVRREVYERIGGFDERFFFYGDESDWEKRMVDAGWKLAYLDEAHVRHLVGKSGKGDRLRFTLHYYASRDQYMVKHYGPAGLAAYRLGVLCWCLRKLGQQAWWRLRPDRQVNPFAVSVHRFLLRTLLCRSSRIAQCVPCSSPDPLTGEKVAG